MDDKKASEFAILTSGPNDEVSIGITSNDITQVVECYTSDILWLVSVLENSHALVQSTTSIKGPERDVRFPTSYYAISFQWMEFCGNYCIN